MPTLAAVQAAADLAFDAAWTTAVTRQGVFLSSKSRHFQGQRTTPLASLPGHANDAGPVVAVTVPVLTGHPTDQTETWVDFAAGLPGTLPCSIELGIYLTPASQRGFFGRVWIKWDGSYYYRANDSGRQPARTHGWRRASATTGSFV